MVSVVKPELFFASLRMPDQELVDRLKAGVEGWNCWQLENPDRALDHGPHLCGANLTGTILAGADLHNAHLEGAYLAGANLNGRNRA